MDGALHEIELADGRVLEAWASPPSGRVALVLLVGTPCGVAPSPAEHAAAAAVGARYVLLSRPGYGTSTRHPGRAVADVAADVRIVAETLGLERLHVVGHSGGGPHALACAALLPDLVASCALIAGVAPWGAEGLDWLDGMAPENVQEFGAALAGEDELARWLEPWAEALGVVTPEEVAAELRGLVSPVDRASLEGDYAEIVAARFRRAVEHGPHGWVDDDLAFTRDWGFRLADIACPVTVWQGGEDRMVPLAHGAWLAAHVPGAVARLEADAGHLSLAVARFDEIVADVVARGSAPA